MRFKYIKEHNNYDLTLNNEYEGYKYKDGWLLIKDDNARSVLYREECFVESTKKGIDDMEIKILGRTIENTKYRFSVYSFKNEKTLNSVSYRKKDMDLKDIKNAFLYCVMPYKWLENRFL